MPWKVIFVLKGMYSYFLYHWNRIEKCANTHFNVNPVVERIKAYAVEGKKNRVRHQTGGVACTVSCEISPPESRWAPANAPRPSTSTLAAATKPRNPPNPAHSLAPSTNTCTIRSPAAATARTRIKALESGEAEQSCKLKLFTTAYQSLYIIFLS
jgi:hypothetical protein